MDAQNLRAMAQRCRELNQIAINPEVKAQLLEWMQDFETEAIEAEAARWVDRKHINLS
jgi:hypothetical protein